MFGYVTANVKELTHEQQLRYNAVYCGICREIGDRCSGTARITLSYDMAFLAMLLMSLYEPEETTGKDGCFLHPIRPRPWVRNEFTQYAADMNVALAFYKALDDVNDDGRLSARMLSGALEKHYPELKARWPRQCAAIESCITELRRMEQLGETNPDLPASCFGRLMAELMVYREDLWADTLRGLGFALGRFIYLADAMLDYDRDRRKGSYNPFLAHNTPKTARLWDEILLLAMGRCTDSFEKLPLVQDKDILDNILYSGVWVQYRSKIKEEPHG